MKTIIIMLTGFLFLTSCGINSIAYNREKILQKYSQYAVFLNDERIDLDSIYLDKHNIQSIKLDKKQLCMNIIQKNKYPEYTPIPYLEFCDTCKLIIIDGIPTEKDVTIETTAIKDVSILKHATPGMDMRAPIVVIVTKH